MIARGVVARAVEHLWTTTTSSVSTSSTCAPTPTSRARTSTGSPCLGWCETDPVAHHAAAEDGDDARSPSELHIHHAGTSFNLRSSEGMRRERALLFRLVSEVWESRGVGFQKALAGDCSLKSFEDSVQQARVRRLMRTSAGASMSLWRSRPVARRVRSPRRRHALVRRPNAIDASLRARRRSVVGQLRRLLAGVCSMRWSRTS